MLLFEDNRDRDYETELEISSESSYETNTDNTDNTDKLIQIQNMIQT